MATQYTVYVDSSPPGEGSEQRQRLREMLGLSDAKLNSLLRRLPGEVTRPVSESTALSVARRFRRAGLHAFVRPVTTQEETDSVAPALRDLDTAGAERGAGVPLRGSVELDDERIPPRFTDTRGSFDESASTKRSAQAREADAHESPMTGKTPDTAADPTGPSERGTTTGAHSRPERAGGTTSGGGNEDSFGFEDEDDWASQFTTSWRSSPRDAREQGAPIDHEANSRGTPGVSSAGQRTVDEANIDDRPPGRGAGAGERRDGLFGDRGRVRPETGKAESQREADAGADIGSGTDRIERGGAEADRSREDHPDAGPQRDGRPGASRTPGLNRTAAHEEADYDTDELFRSQEPVGPKAPSKILVVALIIVLALLTALLLLF